MSETFKPGDRVLYKNSNGARHTGTFKHSLDALGWGVVELDQNRGLWHLKTERLTKITVEAVDNILPGDAVQWLDNGDLKTGIYSWNNLIFPDQSTIRTSDGDLVSIPFNKLMRVIVSKEGEEEEMEKLEDYKNKVAENLLALHKAGKLSSEDLGKQFHSLGIDREVPRKYMVQIEFELDSDGPLNHKDIREMMILPSALDASVSLRRLDR